jgi:hypothetical protein
VPQEKAHHENAVDDDEIAPPTRGEHYCPSSSCYHLSHRGCPIGSGALYTLG